MPPRTRGDRPAQRVPMERDQPVPPRPREEVFRKWQMAPEGEIAHIITMPHVTREMIDELVDDCAGGPDCDGRPATAT